MKKITNIFFDTLHRNGMLCYVICTLFIFSCTKSEQITTLTLNKTNRYQKIDGFGASDAWRCQYVGKNWPNKKKERIAELLFSKDFDKDGNPLGIGLSIWRFYLGAGSAEQGDSSGIKNEWRRGESFVDKYGNYDWSKQEGQQWFLNKAKSFAVDKFLAFSIAAPVQWSFNGKAYNDDVKTGRLNLKPNHYDDYARFMVDFVKHFKEKGINFDYLSPINEPQWNWETRTQEGTPANNEDILKLTKNINKYITEYNLPTEIVIAEAADLRWLYSDFGKPKRGNQIDYFFKNNQIKNLKNTISGHSYFTTWPVDSLIQIREKLQNKLLNYPNLNYWQSEFCILEKNDDIEGGRKRDLGMATALYVARVMHADLTITNATSWQWWTSITNADYKDGLIYLDTGIQDDMNNLEKLKYDGNFHDSKLLWSFGNFSRFIRPGMVRIDLETNQKNTLKQEYKDIMFSAYLNPKNNKVAIIAINYSKEAKKIKIPNFKATKMYVTSKNKNLEYIPLKELVVDIEPQSVNTIIGD